MPKVVTITEVVETSKTTKLQTIIQLLQRPDGALLDELVSATTWQKHSVRGAISGALRKKHKLQISSTVVEGRGLTVVDLVVPPSLAIEAAVLWRARRALRGILSGD